MIGAAGSRHLNSRRRGSSPNVSPHLLNLHRNSQLSTQTEEDETTSSEPLEIELPSGFKPAGRRRGAVTTKDYKNMVLVHANLKGLNLGDVA